MKIVSVMTTDSRGGAEFAAVEMLDALIERGHDAVMLSDQPAIARDSRVRVEPIDIGPKLAVATWKGLALRWWPYGRRLRRALEAEWPYDVLLLHYKKEQLMSRWLPDRLRPTVAWAEWGPVPYPMRRGVPRRAYLAAARRADVVMAVSEGTRRGLTDLGIPAEKVHYVPNVMSVDELGFTAAGRARVRSRLGIPEEAFVVGCISRFHPKKRNDVVIDAVAALDHGAHLVLAGDGETEGELRSRARALGDRAHFVPTPREDVADYLSAFDVCVFCPSPTEGAPRAVLLGMLASRPCVATGAEGVADIIAPGTGAIAQPENDPSALAELLRGYAEDRERAAREGEAARVRVETTYAAPRVAERIDALLSAAAQRSA